MKDEEKTKGQLIEELKVLRGNFSELESTHKATIDIQGRYRDFIENMDDVCFELDLEGKIIFGNDALPRLSGYTPEEYQQLKREERYATPEEWQRIFRIYIDMYRKGKRGVRFFSRHRSKEGKILTLETSALLVRDAEGNPVGFRGISRDVTERIRVEEDLKKYKEFLENIEDSCYERDFDGHYLLYNDALLRKSGFTIEELTQESWETRIVSQEERQRARQVYAEVYRTGIPAKLTINKLLRKDGGIQSVELLISLSRDAAGTPKGYRIISRLITERVKMEQEQERYRTFFESIEEVCFENDLNGTVTFMNEAMCRILGYKREELQNMNFRQFATEDTAERLYMRYNEIFKTGKPGQFYNFEIVRSDGVARFLDMTVSLIRDAEGSPIGFRGVARDVTERKRMEEEQEGLREQINQARKLESIGTLAGGIAHDFNNLLMGIQGYTSLMLLDIDPQHSHNEPLKAIESQVRSGAELTKQLLGYARRGRYEVKSTDLNELLTKTVSMFSRTNNEIQIYQKYKKLLWKTEVDPRQIEQVFLDLFLNAAQAMPGGGSLCLETENTILDEQYIKPYEIRPGAYVKISVTDTGTGMDEETMLRIFEPFFTTKDMTRGAGLGLAAAYGIIKGHKGIINVYSEKGHGTTFKIFLPAIHQEEIRQEEPAIDTVKKQITILFVDDEKAITEVTGAMLERLGHRVIIAHGGKEEVVMYRMNRDRIDLVIMDMIMPDMSGGEAIEKIKSINSKVKVILSSGYSVDGMAREIMDRGVVQAFLQKPFQLDLLINRMNEVLGV